ncbi:MAG: hypothetical protein ACP5C3_09635 [Methanomicrobiales archaeon]
MKALLLRVGIDKGSGGILAPIFVDGSFEYIPIPEMDEKSAETQTFNNTMGKKGTYLSYYLPSKFKNKKMHLDPEFTTFTYGDVGVKAKYLAKLEENDLIVFYAGLKPYDNKIYPEALYIIGYFTVDKVFDFKKLDTKTRKNLSNTFHNNAHIKRSNPEEDLVIVAGNPEKSKLLDRAILISAKKLDKRGRKYHAVSPEMEKKLDIKGSIQRSIPPRFIKDEKIVNLQILIGIID